MRCGFKRATAAAGPVWVAAAVLAAWAVTIAGAPPSFACDTWQSGTAVNGTAVNVTVGSGEVAELLGCVAEGVNVTLQCAPGSGVVLRGWAAVAMGWVVVTGPPGSVAGAWALTDVSVSVADSVVVALAGPAVGVVVAPAGSGTVLVQNVSLRISNSTLRSGGGNSSWPSAAAAVAVVASAGAVNVSVANVTLAAANSSLSATGDGGGCAAVLGVALLAAGQGSGRPSAAVLSNVSMEASAVVADAVGAANGSCVAGVVATGDGWGTLELSGVGATLSGSNLSAVAQLAAAAGGVAAAAGGDLVLMRVSGGVWRAAGGNASARAGGGNGSCAAAALGGVAVAAAQQVIADGVESSCAGARVDAAAVGSGASAAAAGALAVAGDSSLLQVLSAVVLVQNGSVVAVRADGTGRAAAACAGGVAAGSSGASQSLDNLTAWIAFSNVSSNSSCANSDASSAAYSAAAVLGVAAGSASGAAQRLGGGTAAVHSSAVQCVASAATSKGDAYSASAVMGVAAGSAGTQTLVGYAAVVDSSTVTCDGDSDRGANYHAYAAAALFGAAAGDAGGTQDHVNVSVRVTSTTASVNSRGTTVHNYFTAYSASSVAGTAAGNAGAEQQQRNATTWVNHSSVTASSRANTSDYTAYSACVVAGVAAGSTAAGGVWQQQEAVLTWIGYSNVSAYSDSTSTPYLGLLRYDAYSAAAVVGVAAADPGGFTQRQVNVAVWIGYSNVSSNSSSGSGLALFSAAAVVSVATGTCNVTQWQTGVVLWAACASIVSGSTPDYGATASVAAGTGCPSDAGNGGGACCGNNTAVLLAIPTSGTAVAAPGGSVCIAPPTPTISPTLTLTHSITPTESSTVGTPTRTASSTASVVAPALVPPLVPPALSTTVGAVTTTASLSSVVYAGASGAAALQVARIDGVLAIVSACRRDAGDVLSGPLAFPQSLLPFLAIGSSPGRYLRGAVLANGLILPAVLALLGVVIGIALRRALRARSASSAEQRRSGADTSVADGPTWRLALRTVRMPALLLVLCSLGVDGLAVAAVALPLKQQQGGAENVALAVLAAALVVGFIGAVAAAVRRMTRGGPGSLIFVPVTMVRSDGSDLLRNGAWRPWRAAALRAVVVGGWAWLPLDPTTGSTSSLAAVTNAELGLLVVVYGGREGDGARPGRVGVATYWFAIEATATAIVGAAEGATVQDCTLATWLVVAATAAILVLGVIVRPFVVPAKNIVMSLTNALMLAAALCAALGAPNVASALGSAAGLLTVPMVLLVVGRYVAVRALGGVIALDRRAWDRYRAEVTLRNEPLLSTLNHPVHHELEFLEMMPVGYRGSTGPATEREAPPVAAQTTAATALIDLLLA